MTLIFADDRSYLTSLHDERYTLGGPAAPAVTLNAADEYGCAWAADEPDGWDAPTVETPMDRRPSGHGGFAGRPTFEPRTLSVEGAVTAPSRAALRAARDRLFGALLDDLGAPLRYTHLDDDPEKGLWVLPSGKPRFRALDERVAEFAFVLLAEDPIKTGAAVTYGPVRLSSLAAGRAAYPLTFPALYVGGSGAVTLAAVQNPGTAPAHARYRVHGPVPEPVIALSSGEFVHLTLTLGPLDEAVIDTSSGAVRVNGVNRYDAWGPGSTFPLIPRGGAEVRLRSAAGGADPAASLLIDTAPAWR